jgi:hypothetical protein
MEVITLNICKYVGGKNGWAKISGYCVFEGEMLLREQAMAFEPTPLNTELAKSSPFPCPSVVLLSCVFQKLLL